jgi:hypothetical protein
MDVEPKSLNLLAHIVNKSTNVKVQSFDSFVKNFTYKSVSDKNTLKIIKAKFADGVVIGTVSGFGIAKKVKDGDKTIVIKHMELCPNIQMDIIKQEVCDVARAGDFIFHIPDSVDNKTILLAPNTLTELIISKILGQGTIQKYCPNFTKIYDVEYDRITDKTGQLKPSAYILMELLIPLSKQIQKPLDSYWSMFQMSWAISRAQELHRYVHFDLHRDNFMSRNRDPNIMAIYDLGNGNFLHSRQTFDTVIIDYGMNRLETKENIIIPRIMLHPAALRQPDWLDYYSFNPYIDMFATIYSGMYLQGSELYKDGEITQQEASDNYIVVAGTLLRYMFSLDDSIDLGGWIQNNILLNYWRPKPEQLGTIDEKNHLYPPHTPQDMVIELANIFEKYQETNGPTRSDLMNVNNANNIAAYMKEYPVVTNRQLTDLVGKDGIKSFILYPQIPKKDKMNISYDPVITIPLDYFKNNSVELYNKYFTIDSLNFKGGDIVGHLVTINQNYLVGNKGYEWQFDCCRTIIQDVLREAKVVGGVSINASFFHIHDDYTPIGIFKTKNTVINNPGPEQENYWLVGVGYDGILDIRPQKDIQKFVQVLSSGPPLVDGGKSIDADLCEIKDPSGRFIFNCRQPNKGEENQVSFMDGLTNCNRISPGTLAHACQPNPRTAMFIKKDGTIGLLYFEGRGKRGNGVTLVQLAEICQKLGAERAINLDGGMSSQLVWKIPGQKIIQQINPFHNFVYPVGSTISFLKIK